MINVNDFKTGLTIIVDGNLFSVLEFQHVKPGKGSAFVRSKLKNLRTGATIDYTFNAGIKVETARVEKKAKQFLYSSGDDYIFMDMDDYSQDTVNKKVIGEDTKYLKEGLDVEIIFYKGEILGINFPDKVELTVTKTEPGVKGNTSSTAMKDATLETGYIVKVPLFIDEGDQVIISTKDGKYTSRA